MRTYNALTNNIFLTFKKKFTATISNFYILQEQEVITTEKLDAEKNAPHNEVSSERNPLPPPSFWYITALEQSMRSGT